MDRDTAGGGADYGETGKRNGVKRKCQITSGKNVDDFAYYE